jgi:hypothetical protein
VSDANAWPELSLAAWADTRATLHMYTQIIGKIRLALTPREPQWANVPLTITARGLTTGAMTYGDRTFTIGLDFVSHTLDIVVSSGQHTSIPLIPVLCVADFYAAIRDALTAQGLDVRIWPMPVEIPKPIRFTQDREHAAYDPEYVTRFFRILATIAPIFAEHRAPFRHKHTPLQFFWGSFDLAYVRYSGKQLEPMPNADFITRIAMDSEEVSAGFWPGDDRFPEPAFYSYTFPKPAGIEKAAVAPPAAYWHDKLGEFILRYDDVRTSSDPRASLLAFLSSTYVAGAKLAGWDILQN